MRDTRSYYDEFAGWYERERGGGYHRMVDDLELDLVRRYGSGKDVLEAGCGTGLLLERAASFAGRAVGVDLSAGMLDRARSRGLRVVQGSVTNLPFPTASFDLAYSVKVLAHVEHIERALSELARVVRPGGIVLAEYYNARSLRYLIKRIKPATPVSESETDEAVFTRYDRADQFDRYLPPELDWFATRGVRVVTPVAHVHRIPGVGAALRAVERGLADAPVARHFGGFAIAICRRRG